MRKMFIACLLTAFFSVSPTAFGADSAETTSTKIEIFDVNNIKQGSSLPMRSWPSLTSKIVVALPHNAQSITYKGNTINQGKRIWKKVYWNGNKGWVDASYLQYNEEKTQLANKPLSTPPIAQTSMPINTSTVVVESTTDIKKSKKKTIIACGGSKPFWNMHIDLNAQTILVDLQDGKPFSTTLNNRKWDISNNEMTINGGQEQGKREITALLNKTNTCTDGLTDIKYPFSVKVTLSGTKHINGCCRSIQK